ncbi:glycoside hydrolase family 99-like domain-containing protein [Ottowia sp.]|uniref:glycoside hydrolase family 99-like domain-containing protein n=1 Tax=Ottowia sp. TaxID=1898956 RepID=UPI003A8714A5
MIAWQQHLGVEHTSVTFYHRLVRKELIDLFSSPRRRVIEIGSSAGYTGQYCKQKFPDVEYWGFELNRAAAKESLAQLDKVVVGKFEEQDLALLGLKPHSVDGVVLGDVLEHLYDPWRVLTALLPWLSEDAELVISLPNLRNLWLMNEIAEGRFTYAENGLLDVTHIRFFTLQEIHGLMATTGYHILQGGVALDERLAAFHAHHAPLVRPGAPYAFQYQNVGIRANGETLGELCAKQFMFRAVPKRLLHDLQPAVRGAGVDRLSADYDQAFQPDPVHHVPQLPPAPPTPRARVDLYAFYLPQYHPTPENDRWWGEGFTEWTNVTRARPAFNGHYQPRHPGELGYYDLRVPEVMARQVALAKQAGLAGFIFYYYWFSGTPMLEMPLQQYMARWNEFELPFFVMWCNENWRRTWVDGGNHQASEDVLLAHQHLSDDPERFIDDLQPILSHPGYRRIEGKPVLLVYPLIGPDGTADVITTRSYVARWRARARELGLGELWIGGHEKSDLMAAGTLRGTADLGVDFFFEFPPSNSLTYQLADSANGVLDFYQPTHQINVIYYEALIDKLRALPAPTQPLVKTVLAGSWDNTARKGQRAQIFHGCTPPLYERWLRESTDFARAHPVLGSTSMVFINAWNEWAEGVYLEPDRKYGHALLAATQRVAYGLTDGLNDGLADAPQAPG